MKIRNAKLEDVNQVVDLWKEGGIYFEPFDKKERLEEKIKREPELFLVAEEDNKIIGAVIGNYGWRISIDHLVVAKKYQKKGVGKNLFSKIKFRLKEKGAAIALFDTNLPTEYTKKMGLKYRGKYSNYTVEL